MTNVVRSVADVFPRLSFLIRKTEAKHVEDPTFASDQTTKTCLYLCIQFVDVRAHRKKVREGETAYKRTTCQTPRLHGWTSILRCAASINSIFHNQVMGSDVYRYNLLLLSAFHSLIRYLLERAHNSIMSPGSNGRRNETIKTHPIEVCRRHNHK